MCYDEQIIRGAYTVTLGLVHYHFTNKDELLPAVLREASAAYTRQMAQLGDFCPPAGPGTPT